MRAAQALLCAVFDEGIASFELLSADVPPSGLWGLSSEEPGSAGVGRWGGVNGETADGTGVYRRVTPYGMEPERAGDDGRKVQQRWLFEHWH